MGSAVYNSDSFYHFYPRQWWLTLWRKNLKPRVSKIALIIVKSHNMVLELQTYIMNDMRDIF